MFAFNLSTWRQRQSELNEFEDSLVYKEFQSYTEKVSRKTKRNLKRQNK